VRTPAEFAQAVAGHRGEVRLRVAEPADRKTNEFVVPEA
jgi:hypothetical protein